VTLRTRACPPTDIAGAFSGRATATFSKSSSSPASAQKILKAYRAADLTLEDVMAFTVTDDHEAQERVFTAIAPWQGSREIRAAPHRERYRGDGQARKIRHPQGPTKKAGGNDQARTCSPTTTPAFYIEDPALLDTLVTERPREERQRPSAPRAGNGFRSPRTLHTSKAPNTGASMPSPFL